MIMNNVSDPFLETDRAVNRLVSEYNKHKRLIIAYDFDFTIHNYEGTSYEFNAVFEVLRKFKPYGYFVCYTASPKERYSYISDYIALNDLPLDSINEVNIYGVPKHDGAKIYYNIFLDDRAGLGQAVETLNKVYDIINVEVVKSNSKKYFLYKVDFYESERGWGTRPDDLILAVDISKANEVILHVENTGTLQEYSRAVSPPYIYEVSEVVYKLVNSNPEGYMWFMRSDREKYNIPYGKNK